MGMWQRIMTLFSSNINSVLDSAEDPQAALDQIVRDMGTELTKTRSYLAEAVVNQKKLEREGQKHADMAKDYREKAKIVLGHDEHNDYLAKEALMRCKEQETLAAQYAAAAQKQSQQVEALKRNIQVMERKASEAQSKKGILQARQTVAKAQEAVTAAIAGSGSGSAAFQEFDRVSEKIEDQVDKAQISADLAAAEPTHQLEEISFGHEVDGELENLKKELLIEAQAKAQLPPGTGAGANVSAGVGAAASTGAKAR